MNINKDDLELIELAKDVLRQNEDLYADRNTIVACIVKAQSGKIYKGINIKTSHSICSEQVALGQAFACGERKIDTIVAVKLNTDGSMRVVSPCGLCRYTFDKLGINANIIVEDVENDTILKVRAVDLLPYPYKRDDI